MASDTRFKRKYVRWEAEVTIEKKRRIIGVNLDGWSRRKDRKWLIDPSRMKPGVVEQLAQLLKLD